MSFAFTSRSSAASIPLNIETQTDKLGNNPVVANFSATFGATIGQNGCAGIYPAMLAVMVAPTVGVDPFTVSYIATLVLVVAISSFGIAGCRWWRNLFCDCGVIDFKSPVRISRFIDFN